MGQRITDLFHSRDNEGVEEVAIANSNAYKWPPKSGNYFGSHFIMGGERFDTQQPESFLFGENSDLNFLGNRPMPSEMLFPYSVPQLSEPTRTLRALVNIRKDTIRLVKVDGGLEKQEDTSAEAGGDNLNTEQAKTDPPGTEDGDAQKEVDVEAGEVERVAVDDSSYNIEFTFDSDVTCKIRILYMAVEDVVDGAAVYTPRDVVMCSEPVTYKRGANQLFTQAMHTVQPSKLTDDEWAYSVDKDEIPIVIQCSVDKEPDYPGHSHVTFCVLEHLSDGYHIKAIKQKQCVDGLLYILQEFYGIENKESDHPKELPGSSQTGGEEEFEDNTAECVICMSDIRDTLILPCRHLCLCNGCADSLRYQASNCPICRAPFKALLQLRAIRKKVEKADGDTATNGSEDEDEIAVSQKGVPQGFEAISLIEALNGPCFYNNKSAEPIPAKLTSNGSLRRSKRNKKSKGGKHSHKDKNKDKDDIADEEKERDVENITDQKETEADSAENVTEDSKQEKSEKLEELAAVPDIKESEGSPVTARKASLQEGSSDESDILCTSMASQTTTLPGTPDHVLEDDQLHAEHSSL